MTDKKFVRSIGLISAGMIFLFNPYINIIDILPDFIGYILIICGIGWLADLEDHFGSARRGLVYLSITSAVKCACCLLLPIMDSTFVILFVFTFGVIEAILFVPAFVNIFDGFNYFGVRHDLPCMYNVPSYKALRHPDSGKYSNVQSLKIYTVTAFIIRAALAMLPTLPALFNYDSSGYVDKTTNWSDYIYVFYFLAFVAALIISIPWLIKMLRYLKGIRRDKRFINIVGGLYNENIFPNKGIFANKDFRSARVLLIIGAVFCFNISFDGINFLPNAVAAVLFGVTLVILYKYTHLAAVGIITSALWAVSSALLVVLQAQYAKSNYKPSSFLHGIGASEVMYPRILAVSVIEAVFMAATVVILVASFYKMLLQHCNIFEKSLYVREGKSGILLRKIRNEFIPAVICLALVTVLEGVSAFVSMYFFEIWIINGVVIVGLLTFAYRGFTLAEVELYDKIGE